VRRPSQYFHSLSLILISIAYTKFHIRSVAETISIYL
jgi:hypothetical protein